MIITKIKLSLKMIALLEYLDVALENIDQILVGKVFLSSTLKTLLYLQKWHCGIHKQ